MASQCEMILRHLKTHGSISHREAEQECGIARLAARIADLRHQGVEIASEIVTGKNRHDKTVHYILWRRRSRRESVRAFCRYTKHWQGI